MRKHILFALIFTFTYSPVFGDEYLPISPLQNLSEPTIDGNLKEWPLDAFQKVLINSAIDGDEKNSVGEISIEFASAIDNERIYFAIRWPDTTESIKYRPWTWKGTKYRRSKTRDDMLALRFEQSGDFNRSMIADADYVADVWVWSAGRSNIIGYADDYTHTISTNYIENASEYESPSGNIVYIDRNKDAGVQGYKTFKPNLKVKTTTSVKSIQFTGESSGSVSDVRAKAIWSDGFWSLEISRKLDTGNEDDKAFLPGSRILSQIAIFNKNFEEHKSVSEPLILILP